MFLLLGGVVVLLAAVIMRRRNSWREYVADKGSVSEQWLAEHRASHQP